MIGRLKTVVAGVMAGAAVLAAAAPAAAQDGRYHHYHDGWHGPAYRHGYYGRPGYRGYHGWHRGYGDRHCWVSHWRGRPIRHCR